MIWQLEPLTLGAAAAAAATGVLWSAKVCELGPFDGICGFSQVGLHIVYNISCAIYLHTVFLRPGAYVVTVVVERQQLELNQGKQLRRLRSSSSDGCHASALRLM